MGLRQWFARPWIPQVPSFHPNFKSWRLMHGVRSYSQLTEPMSRSKSVKMVPKWAIYEAKSWFLRSRHHHIAILGDPSWCWIFCKCVLKLHKIWRNVTCNQVLAQGWSLHVSTWWCPNPKITNCAHFGTKFSNFERDMGAANRLLLRTQCINRDDLKFGRKLGTWGIQGRVNHCRSPIGCAAISKKVVDRTW